MAFPAIDSESPRNGGYLFFADGNDHEAYDEHHFIAADNDNHAFPFMDIKSPADETPLFAASIAEYKSNSRPSTTVATLLVVIVPVST